jgi:hypothetical protein
MHDGVCESAKIEINESDRQSTIGKSMMQYERRDGDFGAVLFAIKVSTKTTDDGFAEMRAATAD